MKKPNLLFLCADQFRGDTLGCVGHPDIQTPNIDALAKDGTLFSRAYSPNPICIPARATMISGNYSHKCTGRKRNKGELRPDQIKLPQLLADNGYATYSSGKLHYLPYVENSDQRTLHGFQEACLAESGRIIGQFDPKGEKRGLEDYFDYLDDVGWKGYTRGHGVGNNDIHPATSPLPQEHNVDAWVATRAISYLDKHIAKEDDKPFFLNVSFPKPHSPYDPPRPYDQMYDPRKIQKPAQWNDGLPRSPESIIHTIMHGQQFLSPEAVQVARAHYYGLISFQDVQIGRVIDHLKDKGLYENTIIIFTADHGDMLGDFGWFFKTSMYEGSARIPFIIAWPEKLPKGQLSKSLVGLQDILPTLADLIEIKLPKEVDGISIKPELHNAEIRQRDYFIAYSLESPKQTYMVRDSQYKYIYNQINEVEELYDLSTDLREECNLITDVSHKERIEEMKAKMISWAHEQGDVEFLPNGVSSGPATSQEDPSKASFNRGSLGWRWY